MIYALLFVLAVFISSCSQLILKKVALKKYVGLKYYLNIYTFIGYGIFFLVSLCIILLYRHLALSVGALLESTSYIFIPLLSFAFLRERISKKQIIGILFILVGMVILAIF